MKYKKINVLLIILIIVIWVTGVYMSYSIIKEMDFIEQTNTNVNVESNNIVEE